MTGKTFDLAQQMEGNIYPDRQGFRLQEWNLVRFAHNWNVGMME